MALSVPDTRGELLGHDPAAAPERLESPRPKPLAVCWRNDRAESVRVVQKADLKRLRAMEPEVEHFVDTTGDRPRCSKRRGNERVRERLTPAEVSMLLTFLLRREAGSDPERPESLRIPNLSTTQSKRQTFKRLRRKVDNNPTSRQQFLLFKAHRSLAGGPQLYELRPDDEVTFCFLVRPEQLAAVRRTVSR